MSCPNPVTFFARPVFAGVCLLSKLSQLKQNAYQAGKKKDWDQAVSIYEKILDLEKNNPTVINEMGDLCLKAGESARAISHFLKAAAKYRKTGLLNNAVAIYKKILRHDPENLNAHWYLAETRASQGLVHEGELHGLRFLTNSEEVTGELKEIFLGRCRELFELFPASHSIQEHLLKVFRTWDMSLEAARCLCLLACIQYDAGEEEQARVGMEEVTTRTPEVVNYPEYTKWNNRINPITESAGTFSGFGEVNLGDADPEPAAEETPGKDSSFLDFSELGTPEPTQPEPSEPLPVADETSFGDLKIEVDQINSAADTPVVEIPAAPEIAQEVDDEGCFTLDTSEETSFEDLIAQATDETAKEPATPAPAASGQGMDDLLGGADHSQTGEVDLLAEILAEDGPVPGVTDADQLSTITQEIGAQVGGDEGEADAGRQYEMGLVYLEMGLFEQACSSLEIAAADVEYGLRAHEMWGVALCRANRPDDAVATLSSGLERAEEGSQQYLGLLYHIGKAHEQAERPEAARECFEKIQAQDRSFLDVGKRLAALPVS